MKAESHWRVNSFWREKGAKNYEDEDEDEEEDKDEEVACQRTM